MTKRERAIVNSFTIVQIDIYSIAIIHLARERDKHTIIALNYFMMIEGMTSESYHITVSCLQ